MPEKDIFASLSQQHVWLAWLTAAWGGIVAYLRQLQQGRAFRIATAVIHLLMSGFSGLMCWLACVHYEVPPALTAICTGLAGYSGAEFIKILEDRFLSRVKGQTP